MRYSEMIAREKQRARRRRQLPGNVTDLRLPGPLWIIGSLAMLLLLTFS